jgi:hypothetical protein
MQSMKPRLVGQDDHTVSIDHPLLPPMRLACDGHPDLLFCDNDTNVGRLGGQVVSGGYFKDGINDYLVNGNLGAVNPGRAGTKFAAHYQLTLPPSGTVHLRLRLVRDGTPGGFKDFDGVFSRRRAEADDLYAALQYDIADPEVKLLQRRALAGIVWSKQFYYYNVAEWLVGDPLQPPPPRSRRQGRNSNWRHFNSVAIVSTPDKWEYPSHNPMPSPPILVIASAI